MARGRAGNRAERRAAEAGRGGTRSESGRAGGRPTRELRGGTRGQAPPRQGRPDRREERDEGDDAAARRFRGSVARRGARVVTEPDDRWTGDDRDRRSGAPRPEWEPEVWVEEAPETEAPRGARPQGARPARPRKAVPEEVQLELRDTVDSRQSPRVAQRLAQAVEAYERDRYEDALRLLRPIARQAPTSPAVRELLGLTLYRLGKWRPAIRELEAFHALTGSVDQHPVLMDSHRATARWPAVEATWEQLRQASPPSEVLNEGRIVMAAALADRGDLAAAIELLARVPTKERPPPLHHLRVWYTLADLYERAGDVPRARTLFSRVLDQDPALFDTQQRLAALG